MGHDPFLWGQDQGDPDGTSGVPRGLAGRLLHRVRRYIYFLDADDLLCMGAIQQVQRHFDDRVSKIQFMLTPIDQHGAVIGPPFPKLDDTQDSRDLIETIKSKGYYPTPPTSGNIYRRDVYENLGDLDYERAIDGVPYLLAPSSAR